MAMTPKEGGLSSGKKKNSKKDKNKGVSECRASLASALGEVFPIDSSLDANE